MPTIEITQRQADLLASGLNITLEPPEQSKWFYAIRDTGEIYRFEEKHGRTVSCKTIYDPHPYGDMPDDYPFRTFSWYTIVPSP